MKKVVFLIAVIAMVSCGTKNQSQEQKQDSIAVDTATVDSAAVDTFKLESL